MNVATQLAGMLLAHPYLGLAVVVVVEGPSATVVAGRLVAAGVIACAELADVAAVPTFAALGASGVPYRRFTSWIGATTSVEAAGLLTLGWALAHDLLPTGTSPATVLRAGTALSITIALTAALVTLLRRRLRTLPRLRGETL